MSRRLTSYPCPRIRHFKRSPKTRKNCLTKCCAALPLFILWGEERVGLSFLVTYERIDMKRKDSKKKTRRYGVCNDGRERSKTKMVGKSHGYGCSWSEAVSTSQVAWCPYKEFDHESGLILVCS